MSLGTGNLRGNREQKTISWREVSMATLEVGTIPNSGHLLAPLPWKDQLTELHMLCSEAHEPCNPLRADAQVTYC